MRRPARRVGAPRVQLGCWLAVFLLRRDGRRLRRFLAEHPHRHARPDFRTYLIYGLTLLITIVIVAGVPWFIARRMLRGASRTARFAVLFFLTSGLALAGAFFWFTVIWPVCGSTPRRRARGRSLFAELRPGQHCHHAPPPSRIEMSELEFYSWWPLRVIPCVFVLNLVVATVRRIEFIFVNIGVLTVHGHRRDRAGQRLVLGLKQEGDTILLAGRPTSRAFPPRDRPRMPSTTTPTSHAVRTQDRRPGKTAALRGVLANDYNLGARERHRDEASRRACPGSSTAAAHARCARCRARAPQHRRPRALVPAGRFASTPSRSRIGSRPPRARLGDARFIDVRALPADAGPRFSIPPHHLSRLTSGPAKMARSRPTAAFAFIAARRGSSPYHRERRDVGRVHDGHVRRRWADLASSLPPELGTPSSSRCRARAKAARRSRGLSGDGEPGNQDRRDGLHAEGGSAGGPPPFPIITPGYRDAQSSVAIVRDAARRQRLRPLGLSPLPRDQLGHARGAQRARHAASPRP